VLKSFTSFEWSPSAELKTVLKSIIHLIWVIPINWTQDCVEINHSPCLSDLPQLLQFNILLLGGRLWGGFATRGQPRLLLFRYEARIKSIKTGRKYLVWKKI
jgi:hypothetical protein